MGSERLTPSSLSCLAHLHLLEQSGKQGPIADGAMRHARLPKDEARVEGQVQRVQAALQHLVAAGVLPGGSEKAHACSGSSKV